MLDKGALRKCTNINAKIKLYLKLHNVALLLSMIYAKPYSAPADACADFLAYASQARTKIEAHPEWKEWLLSPEIIDPQNRRGLGKWRQDWLGLAGPGGELGFETALAALRKLKQREYLRLGLLDFSGFHSVEETMRQVSDLADFCLQMVLEVSQRYLTERFGAPPTPFCILGMGKLGGQELNYSSDIDVIFVYGEDGEVSPTMTCHEYYTRLAQRIISAFSTQTGEGNLFRIDLRLRPEGDSGALASSMAVCENYYAAYGETWERMAMLKARPSAGDRALGYEFDQMRAAFCYPRSLSLDVIEEIAALKERIEREVVKVENLDLHVKLGTGGIREIEFIVQALQVLNGARLPYFQHRSTLPALKAAATLDILPASKVEALTEAYLWWRTVEHRLQMAADLQTHSLPRDSARRAEVAATLGLELPEFERLITYHRHAVREVFDEIFSEHKTVVVETIITTEMFAEPEHAIKDLEALEPSGKSERHVSPRTHRSYQRFCHALNDRLQTSVDPDACLTRLVRFVEAYGARSLLYESLANNPKAFDLLLKIFDRSRFYADLLVSRPELFEESARCGTLDFRKTSEDYVREIHAITGDPALESRRYRRAELLRIFLRDILELAPLPEIQREYSALARACLEYAIKQANPKSPLTVIAMGKFGGAELSYGSDLDCLMIGEDANAGRAVSKFMADIMPTGILFPVDFRLRPNGEGPICVPLEAYVDYYRDKAQLWEIQALTRFRVVAGDVDLGAAFTKEIEPIWLERARLPDAIEQVAKMRYRIETERVDPAHRDLEFKTGVGGLIDVEFGLQMHLMSRGIREPGTWKGLDLLAEQRPDVEGLWRGNYLFLRRVESILRCNENDSVSKLPKVEAELNKLARRLGFPGGSEFKVFYDRVRAEIRAGYEKLMPPVPH